MRLNMLTGQEGNGSGPEVVGITSDSRKVRPGWLFAAIPGTQVDGRIYIADAVAKGAVAVLAEEAGRDAAGNAIFIPSDNVRRDFAKVAARFHAPQPETIVAVTGTNGKTSIAEFVRQLFEVLGRKAGTIGTLGIRAGDEYVATGLTTPDAAVLMEALKSLKAQGVDHAAIEASSHGLKQYRLDGVKVRAAGFTNLTRDHADYHPDEADYFNAKARLFSELLDQDGVAVINLDGARGDDMMKVCASRGVRTLTVGRGRGDLNIEAATATGAGQDLTISADGQVFTLTLPLVGGFQAENALVAAGLVIACGFKASDVLPLIAGFTGVPGRMQYAGRTKAGGTVYVDFAHTPDGIASVLGSARAHATGRLCILFGCGGDRDPGKRPMMGEIAAQRADVVYVTDDNPRSEEPAAIRAAIMAATPGGIEVDDRRKAIHQAVADLGAGDLLILAGKGHETGQIVKGEVLPFSDIAEARNAIRATGGEAC